MRLFLLPVSTRRTLIFCERTKEAITGAKPPLQERIITKASQTWASWERADKGWQKKVTLYGNSLFKNIPFQEWGLKTLPSASKKHLQDVDEGKIKVDCLYPASFLKPAHVSDVLKRIATERQGLHTKRFWQCVFWMPITIPFALVPVVPNLPFFYVLFRAWSHHKALSGSKFLQHLVDHNRITPSPSHQLDHLYAAGMVASSRQASRDAPEPTEEEIEWIAGNAETQTEGATKEVMLLRKWNGKLLAEAFGLPEMEIEIERAVEQVEKAVKEDEDRRVDATPSATTDVKGNETKK